MKLANRTVDESKNKIKHKQLSWYLPIETEKRWSHIRVDLYYDLGGMNYFSGKVKERGYYIGVKPVVSNSGTNGMFEESVLMGEDSGGYVFIAPTERFSQKALLSIKDEALARSEPYINAVAMKLETTTAGNYDD